MKPWEVFRDGVLGWPASGLAVDEIAGDVGVPGVAVYSWDQVKEDKTRLGCLVGRRESAPEARLVAQYRFCQAVRGGYLRLVIGDGSSGGWQRPSTLRYLRRVDSPWVQRTRLPSC